MIVRNELKVRADKADTEPETSASSKQSKQVTLEGACQKLVELKQKSDKTDQDRNNIKQLKLAIAGKLAIRSRDRLQNDYNDLYDKMQIDDPVQAMMLHQLTLALRQKNDPQS